MGKTFRKEKTVSKQRQRLNKKGKGSGNFHFEEYYYDPKIDNPINGIEDNYAEEIHPSEKLHKQRPSESSDKTDNG